MATNNLDCDCSIFWFRDWLTQQNLNTKSISGICSSPGWLQNKNIMSILRTELTCGMLYFAYYNYFFLHRYQDLSSRLAERHYFLQQSPLIDNNENRGVSRILLKGVLKIRFPRFLQIFPIYPRFDLIFSRFPPSKY